MVLFLDLIMMIMLYMEDIFELIINDGEELLCLFVSVGDMINFIVFVILILFVVFGNFLIFVVVFRSKNFCFWIYFYIVSFLLVNLFMVGVVMFFWVMSFVKKSIWFVNLYLCEIYGSFFVLFCIVIVYIFVVMSLDWYFLIFWYKWY